MTTRAASEIVIGPVITERTYQLYTQGRYTFRVSPRASKTDIKKALEVEHPLAQRRLSSDLRLNPLRLAPVVWPTEHLHDCRSSACRHARSSAGSRTSSA